MKKLAILCACAFTLSLTACSLKPAPQVEVTEPETEEVTTETETTEPEAEATETTNESGYATLEDGWYNTNLVSEDNEYTDDYVKSIEFVDGGLVIEAIFYRFEGENYDSKVTWDMNTYFVPIDENTQCQSSGGMGDPIPMPLDEFQQYLQNCMGSGLGFGIEMENGVAKTLDIFS